MVYVAKRGQVVHAPGALDALQYVRRAVPDQTKTTAASWTHRNMPSGWTEAIGAESRSALEKCLHKLFLWLASESPVVPGMNHSRHGAVRSMLPVSVCITWCITSYPSD
jgi:hypothetical protein